MDEVLSKYELTVEQLCVRCSRELSIQIASKVPRWEHLAPILGLGEEDEVTIKSNHAGDYSSQRVASLTKWRQKFGEKATYLELLRGLERIQRLDLVGIVCRLIKSTLSHSCSDSITSRVFYSDLETLDTRIEMLEERFRMLVKDAFKEIKSSSVSVEEFQIDLTLLPSRIKANHLKYIKEIIPKLKEANDLREIFLYLNLYWDYFNYTLLEVIIKRHGSEELNEKMKKYILDLKDFWKSTTVADYIPICESKRKFDANPEFKEIKCKMTKPVAECTLLEIEILRSKFCREYQLQEFVLILFNLEESSVMVTWLVHETLLPCFEKPLGVEYRIFLLEMNVEYISVSKTFVYNKECEPIQDTPDLACRIKSLSTTEQETSLEPVEPTSSASVSQGDRPSPGKQRSEPPLEQHGGDRPSPGKQLSGPLLEQHGSDKPSPGKQLLGPPLEQHSGGAYAISDTLEKHRSRKKSSDDLATLPGPSYHPSRMRRKTNSDIWVIVHSSPKFPSDLSDEAFLAHFKEFRYFIRSRESCVARNFWTSASHGFGLLNFRSREDAEAAVEKMADTKIEGKYLLTSLVIKEHPRDSPVSVMVENLSVELWDHADLNGLLKNAIWGWQDLRYSPSGCEIIFFNFEDASIAAEILNEEKLDNKTLLRAYITDPAEQIRHHELGLLHMHSHATLPHQDVPSISSPAKVLALSRMKSLISKAPPEGPPVPRPDVSFKRRSASHPTLPHQDVPSISSPAKVLSRMKSLISKAPPEGPPVPRPDVSFKRRSASHPTLPHQDVPPISPPAKVLSRMKSLTSKAPPEGPPEPRPDVSFKRRSASHPAPATTPLPKHPPTSTHTEHEQDDTSHTT